MSEPSTLVFTRATAPNRLGMWFAATRPAFLTASVFPVLAASVMCAAVSDVPISLGLVLLSVISIIIIHMGANVLNDYFDNQNGTDITNQARIFPFTGGSRFIQNDVLSAAETKKFGIGLMVVGALLGSIMVALTTPLLLWVGLAGGVAAVLYSMPGGLAARGFGDLTIALCFGLLPVIGVSLILLGEVHQYAWWVGGILGVFTAAILWINSIPDIEADAKAGKHTLPSRLGAKNAPYGLAGLYALGFLLLVLAPFPKLALITLIAALPAAASVLLLIKQKWIPAIPLTILTHALVCSLIGAGLFFG